MPKVYSLRNLPPCPDPELYILVKTRRGYYWRRKRGTVKDAPLNEPFQQQSDNSKVLGPAVKKLRMKLAPYLAGVRTGYLQTNWTNSLRASLRPGTAFSYLPLRGYDFQRDHPWLTVMSGYNLETQKNFFRVRIPVGGGLMRPQNNLVTEYYFELVLLYGNVVAGDSLRIDEDVSPLYAYEDEPRGECVLEVSLPTKKKPWMLMLKLNALEGDVPAVSPRHYAMMVIGAG